ncbi:MAG: glutamine-hydrolyzing carbamoyl-phosphate synthase small subunit [Bacillota bacterium]
MVLFRKRRKGGAALQTLLVLEDGFTLKGESFSGKGEVFGEVVFNTSMTGYQEMVTDPSYRGQILNLTCPMIGNYGVNEYDSESALPQVEGLLVKEYCRQPRSWRARESLGVLLDRHGILGVEGIDTRSLTLHLRRAGTMNGALSTIERDPAVLLRRVSDFPGITDPDLVGEVTSQVAHPWTERSPEIVIPVSRRETAVIGEDLHVVVYDFGVKYSILRSLANLGCRVTVVPCRTSAAEALALKPDGILLSNGPGDPVACSDVLPAIRDILGRVPVFGICLGHQLLGMALGFSTFKLVFGHRGGNHPVRELSTGKVLITSQNHGYCLQLGEESGDTVPTHINMNDGTLEGLENRGLRCFSVQYHPEAAPGPQDSTNLYEIFVDMMQNKA